MKIRFQPRRGTPTVTLRDLKGNTRFGRWDAGEEKEIPADAKVVWQDGNSPPKPIDVITAIFRHGPDFVDAATGKNPLYSCADCGAEALEEQGFNYQKDEAIPLVNDKAQRLCVACFLGHHPEYIVEFRRVGTPADVIARAQKLAADHAAPAEAPAAPKIDAAIAPEVK
ncbi:MAG TPA: hypothetical protein VHR97_01740 [Candidatus Baltobacteraceae bacterium]|jgi:hypothetical protein|nr:hypothetical protein [Candidatus Baltobacteraceae bacterium]